MQKLDRGGRVRSGGGVAAAHDEPNRCNATVALSAPVRRHGGADVWPLFCPAQRLHRARTCRTSRASDAPPSSAVFVRFIACSSESFLFFGYWTRQRMRSRWQGEGRGQVQSASHAPLPQRCSGVCISLCGSEAVPTDGFCSVLRNASTALEHEAHVELRSCMPLCGC